MSKPDPVVHEPAVVADQVITATVVEFFPEMNAYRDGALLMVGRWDRQLPQVCLKTGQATHHTFTLRDNFISGSLAMTACLAGGALGYQMAKKIWGEPVSILLPLDAAWLEAAAAKTMPGWITFAIGLIVLLLTLVIAVDEVGAGYFIPAGMFIMIAGIIWVYFGSQIKACPFRVAKLSNQYIWISGVNSAVLARFPSVSQNH